MDSYILIAEAAKLIEQAYKDVFEGSTSNNIVAEESAEVRTAYKEGENIKDKKTVDNSFEIIQEEEPAHKKHDEATAKSGVQLYEAKSNDEHSPRSK